jgi:hypothetical protein
MKDLLLSCVVDRHPRFYVELVLWAHCVARYVPRQQVKAVVYFVGETEPELAAWLSTLGIESRTSGEVVAGSPHCNKIHPFLEEDARDFSSVVVTDADVYFVADPLPLIRPGCISAPPNNHCNPPAAIYRSILDQCLPGRHVRPGLSLFPGEDGTRETFDTNISAGIVAMPGSDAGAFASRWKAWAEWLVAHRELLGRWAVHVDQVAFSLALEDTGRVNVALPPNVNAVLQLLPELETLYALHLTTGHIPQFAARFGADRHLDASGYRPGVSEAVDRLNACVDAAMEDIGKLRATRDYRHMFLNPYWTR